MMDQEHSKLISFILPMYNESENIESLVNTVCRYIPEDFDYEFILVDDGSKDNTLAVVSKMAERNNKIKVVSFYRNFGHQAALYAGLREASGALAITMDSDFQHPPDQIPVMISKWKEGYDLVLCQKKRDSTSSLWMKIIRFIGYKIYNMVGELTIPGVSDFRLMDKVILDYVRDCNEINMVLRGMVMLPAKKIYINQYTVQPRKTGRSGYTFLKRLDLFLYTITSFSVRLLRFSTLFGVFLIIMSFIYLMYILIGRFILKMNFVPGWTAIIMVMLILFGFTFIYLGIISEYLGVVFSEVKKRPRYIISQKINL